MAQQTLQVISLHAPTPTSSSMSVTLLPSTPTPSTAHLFSASTSLALSLHNGDHEIYLDRLTQRDLEFQDNGSVIARINETPRFATPHGQTSVKVYMWKGEKLLGEWDAGSY